MKKVLFVQRPDTPHWVGDGFPVRSLFSYRDIARQISPFLLLDYAGPTEFTASTSPTRRGVGSHPHRGFETVTIVYDGQVEHRDSAGGGGVIGPGEVQWMTAASGLVHEERHGVEFSKNGGRFEMVQLWVNLPKKHKMTSPRYQGLRVSDIPEVNLPEGAGRLRVIAGNYQDIQGQSTPGSAKTFSPINLWDLRLNKEADLNLKLPVGHTALVFVLSGKVQIGQDEISEAELAVLEPEGDTLNLKVLEESKVLLMGGEPLNEPIAAYGPFVMNNFAEIHQAMVDFEEGKMGSLMPIEGSEV